MILLGLMFLSWNFLCVAVGLFGLGDHDAEIKVLSIGLASSVVSIAAYGLSR